MVNVKDLETTEKLGEENQNLPSWGHTPGSGTLVCVTSERGHVLMRPATPRAVFFTSFIVGLSL